MCLGIPGQIVQIIDGFDDQLALVDVVGAQRKINIGMLEDEDLAVGDWIAIHMGFAMERIDQAEAEEALAGLEMMGRPRQANADSETPHA